MLRLRWCRKQKELAMKTDQDHFTPMRAVRLWQDPRPMITPCIPMQIWQFYPMTSHVCFGRYKLRHFVGLDPASALLAQASSQLGAIVLRSCK